MLPFFPYPRTLLYRTYLLQVAKAAVFAFDVPLPVPVPPQGGDTNERRLAVADEGELSDSSVGFLVFRFRGVGDRM